MPELPEIETLAVGLRKAVTGKTIKQMVIHDKKRFKGSPAKLKQFVYGKKIIAVRRKAKWLIIDLSSGYSFVIHLKMTGQLIYQKKNDPLFLGGHTMAHAGFNPNHTRVIFKFKDGSTLFFQDMRRFGYVELYSAEQVIEYFAKKNLGREPIENSYALDYLKNQLLRRQNTSIKAALLNQSVVAGLGNIYVDDTLYVAGVRPTRRVRTLTNPELAAIYRASTKVLKQAIKEGGTSFSDYYHVDGSLGQYWSKRKVYQRTAEPCKKCKTPIKKTKCAGRGTHYCPTCQK